MQNAQLPRIHLPQKWFLAILLFSPLISHAGLLDDLANGIKDVAAKAGLYDARFDEFKKLIDSGKTSDAIKLRSENLRYFNVELPSEKRDYAYSQFENYTLRQMGELVNDGLPLAAWDFFLQATQSEKITRLPQNKTEWDRVFSAITMDLDRALEKSMTTVELLAKNPNDSNNWVPLKREMRGIGRFFLAPQDQENLFNIYSTLDKYNERLDTVRLNLMSAAQGALQRYGLTQTPRFQDVYPIPVNMQEIIPTLALNGIDGWSIEGIKSVQKSYGDYLNDSQRSALGAAYLKKLNKERRPGYLAARAAIDKARADGFVMSDPTPLISAWHYQELDKMMRLELLPVTGATLRTAAAGAKPADLASAIRGEKSGLLMFTTSGEEKIERSVKGTSRYTSASLAGRQRVRNPEYDKAVERVSKARADLSQIKQQSQSLSGGNALTAALAVTAESMGEQDLRDAERAVNTTPQQIEVDVNDNYEFVVNRTVVLNRKPVNYLVIDTETSRRCEGQTELQATSEYQVVSGLRPNDINIKEPSQRGWINELVLEERVRQTVRLPYRLLFDKVMAECKEKL